MRKKYKKYFTLIILSSLLSLTSFGATTAINNGKLTSDLDGNGKAINNLNNVTINSVILLNASGNGRGLTNLNFESGRYPTNAGSTTSLILSKSSSISTNNNLLFNSFSNVDTSNTNTQRGELGITNITLSPISVTFAGGLQNMNPSQGSVCWVTNYAEITFKRDPSVGGSNILSFQSR